MSDLPELHELPGFAAESVRECDRARRDIVRQSVASMALGNGGGTHALAWLGPVQITWRFYLASQGNKVFLSFLRRKEEIQVALDSTLRLRIEPSPLSDDADSDPAARTDVPLSPAVTPPECRLAWPRFLDASSPNQAVFHLEHAATPRRLELPIRNGAIDFGLARLMAGNTPLTLRSGNRLLLEPFVDWIETVGAWLRAPESATSWQPLAPIPTANPPPARGILESIVQTYRKSRLAAHTSAPPASNPTKPAGPEDLGRTPDSEDWIPHRQAITEFTGMTWLRLKADGTALAESAEEDSTTLEMRYALGHDGTRDWLEVRLQPPDFLLSGTLHRQILDTVAEAILKAEWHLAGGKLKSSTDIPEARVREFFTQSNAIVMRIRRKRDRDLDLILVRGTLQEKSVWVILTAWLEIGKPTDPTQPETRTLRVARPPTVQSTHGATALMQASNQDNDALNDIVVGEQISDDAVVPTQVLDSFGRLMLALHRWGGIWPGSQPANPS